MPRTTLSQETTKKVFVFEDSVRSMSLTIALLKYQGMEVTDFDDFDDLLNALVNQAPDLLVVHKLPYEKTLQHMMKDIQSIKGMNTTPILHISGQQNHALTSGIDQKKYQFMIKPMKAQQFCKTVERLTTT